MPSRVRNGLLVQARSLLFRMSVDCIIATNDWRPDPIRGLKTALSSPVGYHCSRGPPSGHAELRIPVILYAVALAIAAAPAAHGTTDVLIAVPPYSLC